MGWTYIATSALPGAKHEILRRKLLFKAVHRDPGNLLAQLALKHERYRRSDDIVELDTYISWLSLTLCDRRFEHEGLTALHLRLPHTAAAVALNRYQILANAENASEPDRDKARDTARSFASRLYFEVQNPDGDQFVRQLRDVAAVLLKIAYGPAAPPYPMFTMKSIDDHHKKGVNANTVAQYDDACRLAAVDPVKAVALLGDWIVGYETIAVQMAADPYLSALLGTPEFKLAYRLAKAATSRTSMVDIDPFQPHSGLLKLIGYDTPQKLLDAALKDEDFADYLGLTKRAVDRLRQAAQIAHDIPVNLGDLRFEITEALWKNGFHLTNISDPVSVAAVVETTLADRYLDMNGKGPDLRDWLIAAAIRAHSPRVRDEQAAGGSI